MMFHTAQNVECKLTSKVKDKIKVKTILAYLKYARIWQPGELLLLFY